jgi:hypothetical protein
MNLSHSQKYKQNLTWSLRFCSLITSCSWSYPWSCNCLSRCLLAVQPGGTTCMHKGEVPLTAVNEKKKVLCFYSHWGQHIRLQKALVFISFIIVLQKIVELNFYDALFILHLCSISIRRSKRNRKQVRMTIYKKMCWYWTSLWTWENNKSLVVT